MLCLDSPSFEHNCVLSDDLSWSPSASKLVDTCKNCSYSFRIGSKNSSEGFCSKDCKTCYTLFYKMGSSSPAVNNIDGMKTTAEIKHAIFQFQCQMDEDSLRFAVPHSPRPVKHQFHQHAKIGEMPQKSSNIVFTSPKRTSQSSRFNAFF